MWEMAQVIFHSVTFSYYSWFIEIPLQLLSSFFDSSSSHPPFLFSSLLITTQWMRERGKEFYAYNKGLEDIFSFSHPCVMLSYQTAALTLTLISWPFNRWLSFDVLIFCPSFTRMPLPSRFPWESDFRTLFFPCNSHTAVDIMILGEDDILHFLLPMLPLLYCSLL